MLKIIPKKNLTVSWILNGILWDYTIWNVISFEWWLKNNLLNYSSSFSLDTGAFYSRPSAASKPSRRADALIDHPTVRSKQEQKAMMKRAKSIDLPTVVEEVASINDLQLTPQHPAPPPQNRPKSADSILQNVGKKHRNIKHAKAVGRFSWLSERVLLWKKWKSGFSAV